MSDLEARVRKLERRNAVLVVVALTAGLVAACSRSGSTSVALPIESPVVAQQPAGKPAGKVDEIIAKNIEVDNLHVHGYILLEDKASGNQIHITTKPFKDQKEPMIFVSSKAGSTTIQPVRFAIQTDKLKSWVTVLTDPKTKGLHLEVMNDDKIATFP